MPLAILGSTHTFQVLFIDEYGHHLAGITDASIDIFKMDATGTKVLLVSGPMTPVIPAEDGRFVYPFVLDDSIMDIGDTLYAE